MQLFNIFTFRIFYASSKQFIHKVIEPLPRIFCHFLQIFFERWRVFRGLYRDMFLFTHYFCVTFSHLWNYLFNFVV